MPSKTPTAKRRAIRDRDVEVILDALSRLESYIRDTLDAEWPDALESLTTAAYASAERLTRASLSQLRASVPPGGSV